MFILKSKRGWIERQHSDRLDLDKKKLDLEEKKLESGVGDDNNKKIEVEFTLKEHRSDDDIEALINGE